jgi:hypothetical protein
MQRILKLSYVGHRKDSKKIDFNQKANEFLVDQRKVKYLHSVLDEEKQTETLFKYYYKEVERLIHKDYEEKKINFARLMEFQNFSEGKFTPNNVNTFKKYFIKVNATTGLMNLPKSFETSRNIHGRELKN